MKKLVITGITGFVGQHLVNYFLNQKDFAITGTYRSESSLAVFNDVKDKIYFKEVDCLNQEEVKDLLVTEKPDYIIHLAGKASASKSYVNPKETLTENVLGVFSLVDTMREEKMMQTRLLVVSSGEVYGLIRSEDIPVDETTPFRPVSPYAVSKISQDFLAYQYALTYGLDIVRVRPYNHTGPLQKQGFVVADFAKQIAQIEKGEKEPVITVGNLDAKRDFTDVRDIVRAYHLALEKGEKGEVYNLGSGVAYKIEDVLMMLLELSKTKIEVKKDPALFRPIEVPEIVCDVSKFTDLTGWKPEISLQTTLQDILDYWREIV